MTTYIISGVIILLVLTLIFGSYVKAPPRTLPILFQVSENLSDVSRNLENESFKEVDDD